MPRGRTKGNHDIKRAEIAEAACKVIVRTGFAQASLTEIAREMGYTTGILRHYFADKEELLLFAKNLLVDRSIDKARQAAAGLTGIEGLRAMAISLLASDPTSIDRHRLLATFNGHAIGNARLMKLQDRRNEKHWKYFAEVIAALQKEGNLKKSFSPRLEACGILAFLDGLADQVIMNPTAWSRTELAALMSRYIDTLG